MAKTFRPYVPEQDFLLPPSLRERLPADHLAYFVNDLVDLLDLPAILAPYEREERGYPPYHPVMLTKVLLYAYSVGVFSSRKIQRRLSEDIAFRVLAADNHQDVRTIADFRQRHLTALDGLFVQVLRLAREAGAVRVGRVAIDGSKVRANASKHKAMSYKRLVEKERQLEQEVHHLLTQAQATDAQEDTRHGRDRHGDELPEELRRRETRLARIREAKRVLQERAEAQATAAGRDPDAATPKDKAQYNFTDPESRIMKGPDGFVQAYNAQIAVEATSQLIVGHAVTQEVNDKQQLVPMIETVVAQAGDAPDEVLADSGYCSDANLEEVTARGVDAFIATERLRHGAPPPAVAAGGDPHGPDAPETADEAWRDDLSEAEDDRRTCLRTDQTRAGLPPVSAARRQEGQGRMDARLFDAQRAQVLRDGRGLRGRPPARSAATRRRVVVQRRWWAKSAADGAPSRSHTRTNS